MSKTGYRRAGKAAIAAFFLFPGSALGGEPACSYSWVRIPSPGPGQGCVGQSINNHGVVAGYIYSGGDTYRAFTWSPSTGRVQLPMLPGIISMRANAINDHGVVAGYMYGSAPGSWAGFVWNGTEYTTIPLPEWATQIDVLDINNAGQVVGLILNNQIGPGKPFVWQNGNLTIIENPPGTDYSTGVAINEHGHIVGQSGFESPIHFEAWRRESDIFEFYPTPQGLTSARPGGMNNNGLTVGHAFNLEPIVFKGLIWNALGYEIVVAPPGGANNARLYDINDSGRAVGEHGDFYPIAIVWQAGVAQELRPLVSPPPPHLYHGQSINRAGQIVCEINGGSIVLTPQWLTGDLTGDCAVDLDDLLILLSNFGSVVGSYPGGDVDHDGQVNLADISLMLANWGR